MVRVTFLGSGDAFGSGGRLQTCILVEAAHTRFLMDCGTSVLVAMRRFGIEPNTLDAILISHLHGDHFGGVPFFLLDAQYISRRTRPLVLAGPPGTRERIDAATEVFFAGLKPANWNFGLELHELEPRREARIGNVVVTPFVVDHPSGAPSFALRVQCDGKIITYSGDTQWTEELVPAAEGADLLIAEVYTYDKNVPHHMSYKAWREHEAELAPKRMVATHMSTNALRHLESLDCEIAEDGKVFEL